MTAGKITLSAREVEILAIAWQCFETEPKVNYTKFATLCGYTEGSAKVTLGGIKRKLKNAATPSSNNITTPSSTPRKPSSTFSTPNTNSKKRGLNDAGAVGGGNDGTPSKKAKGNRGSGGGKGKRILDEDEDEEFGNFRVKKEEALGVLQGAQDWLANQPAITNPSPFAITTPRSQAQFQPQTQTQSIDLTEDQIFNDFKANGRLGRNGRDESI